MLEFMPLSILRERCDDDTLKMLAQREWRKLYPTLLGNPCSNMPDHVAMRRLAAAHLQKWGDFACEGAKKI